MKNRFIFFTLGVLFIAVLSYFLDIGIFKRSTTQEPGKTNLQTAASFYPLYFFASEIGKDKTAVFNITPVGVEPHDYEPTPQEIVRIQNSKLLIINGAGFEHWLDKLKGELRNVTIINTSEGLQLQDNDPHVWLSPVLAKSQVDKILQGFIKVDRNNRAFYEANAEELKRRLEELDRKFRQELRSCNQKSLVTSHTAFGYLAREYNLTQVPISGLSPEGEPPPAELAEITRFVRENNVKYIFFETLVSPKLSETIANEVGASTLVLDPIEGISDDDIKLGKNYFTVMEENLKNLQTALECKR